MGTKMEKVSIEVRYCSLYGDRTSQQDSCRYVRQAGKILAAVCDGMGGMAGGEIASKTAISTLFERFDRDHSAISLDNAPLWFGQVFKEADSCVSNLQDSSGAMMNGGSTIVAVYVQDGAFHWGSVGDSRIYHFSKGRLRTLTRSHNYNLKLDEMMRMGQITQQEKDAEGKRGEALISFLGIGNLQLWDTSVSAEALSRGDTIVLCSDGIYKSLNEEQIQAILEESGLDPQLMANRLCSSAVRIAHLNQMKQDNTTVIVIYVN